MELDPNTKARVISEFTKRKKVTYILVTLAALGFLLAIFSYRYDETLTGLPRSKELAIFLSIAGAVLVFTVLYWRCPNCGHHFWWRMQPKLCEYCGVTFVVIKEEKVDPDDWRYYIRLRKRNSLKYGLYLVLIMGINIGLIILLINTFHDIPNILLAFWVLLFMIIPIFIIDRVFRQCPKCGYHFGGWTPTECPHCKTQLKDYNYNDYR